MNHLFKNKVALITGASSGFGEAIARELAQTGISLALGARRTDRLETLRKDILSKHSIEIFSGHLDVQDPTSVQHFVQQVGQKWGHVDYLVNNAGLALGMNLVEQTQEEVWKRIWNTNLMGAVRVTQAVLPLMKSESGCRIVNIGSTAGLEAYEGGGAYCSSKFALRAVTDTLRFELLPRGIGVTSIDPGFAETEFSLVRFDGDQEKAKKTYEGFTPMSAQDIAQTVQFVLTRPHHLSIDQVVLRPVATAAGKRVIRKNAI